MNEMLCLMSNQMRTQIRVWCHIREFVCNYIRYIDMNMFKWRRMNCLDLWIVYWIRLCVMTPTKARRLLYVEFWCAWQPQRRQDGCCMLNFDVRDDPNDGKTVVYWIWLCVMIPTKARRLLYWIWMCVMGSVCNAMLIVTYRCCCMSWIWLCICCIVTVIVISLCCSVVHL